MEIAGDVTRGVRDCRGFSMLQLIVTLAIISVLAGMAILGVRSTRASMRLNAAARTFAQNVEKARLNAIRHHNISSIAFASATSYQISNLADDGTWQTRQFNFDSGVSFLPPDPPPITDYSVYSVGFDWRGRTTQCSTVFTFQNDRGEQATVQVGGSGDVTVNNAISSTPNINFTSVNENSNVVSSATVSGSSTKLSLDPCNSSGGTAVPPPTVTCSGSTWGLNYGSISIRKNGLSTYTITATVPTAGTITTSPDPNLSVSPSSKTFTSSTGGTQSFTVSSVTKTKGTFPINFYFTCSTPAVLYVQVTN